MFPRLLLVRPLVCAYCVMAQWEGLGLLWPIPALRLKVRQHLRQAAILTTWLLQPGGVHPCEQELVTADFITAPCWRAQRAGRRPLVQCNSYFLWRETGPECSTVPVWALSGSTHSPCWRTWPRGSSAVTGWKPCSGRRVGCRGTSGCPPRGSGSPSAPTRPGTSSLQRTQTSQDETDWKEQQTPTRMMPLNPHYPTLQLLHCSHFSLQHGKWAHKQDHHRVSTRHCGIERPSGDKCPAGCTL